jgi:hypothetical protein
MLGTAFAQKMPNPELREEHAANSAAAAKSRKTGSVAAPAVKSNSASELAKIEQSGIKKSKPIRNSTAAHLPARSGAAQGNNKSAKFSYHSPKAGSKGRSNGGRSAASPPKTLR